jgi:hypothetical protein
MADDQITLRHLTAEQLRELCVLAEAVEADWGAVAEKTGCDLSAESEGLSVLPPSRRLEGSLLALDRAAQEELIALHFHHCEVKPTFDECRRLAAGISIDYLLCEPLVELLAVLSGLLPPQVAPGGSGAC